MFFFTSVASAGFYTLIPESYPTDIRSTAFGFIMICARIGAVLAPIITGIILDYIGGYGTAIILFAIIYMLAGFGLIFVSDTRVAKTPLVEDSKEENT
jgi:MFS transporter, putative metabolite:H+ symporter